MPTMIDLGALKQKTRDRLEAGDIVDLRAALASTHPADIAEVIDRLEDEE